MKFQITNSKIQLCTVRLEFGTCPLRSRRVWYLEFVCKKGCKVNPFISLLLKI